MGGSKMIYKGAVYLGTGSLKGRFFAVIEIQEHAGGEIVNMIHPNANEFTSYEGAEDFVRVAARFHANKNHGEVTELPYKEVLS